MVYAATLMLPWMASQSGPGPGRWTLTCLSACRSCHLAATSTQGALPTSPRPPQPHPPEARAGLNGEMTQGPSRPFSAATGHWRGCSKVREGAGGKKCFTVHTGRSSHGFSLRVKGSQACEEGNLVESTSLAWGKEDEAAASGAPCSRRILTTVSALGPVCCISCLI